jgi:hypothetical protein
VVEREASGDFDYLFDDPADADGLSPDNDLWDDPDDNFWDRDPNSVDDGSFDAFKTSTWDFTPAPTPWYRTKQAVTALIAATAAMAAIVVAGVLLVFRTPATTVDDHKATMPPTAPTSSAPATVASSAVVPPPAPPPPAPPPPAPPPPSEAVASSVATAPDNDAPRVQPRPTKEPEIGVTRTPATRSPLSVAPVPRRPRN